MLSAGDLPTESVPLHRAEAHFMVRLGSSMCEVERELILRTLAFAAGNKARASDLLGMSRRNLYNRLQRYTEREFLDDFPSTVTGKILRRELREREQKRLASKSERFPEIR